MTVTPEILGLIPSHITMHGHHPHSHPQQSQNSGGNGHNTTDGPIGNNGELRVSFAVIVMAERR